jgi:hypothetical protein
VLIRRLGVGAARLFGAFAAGLFSTTYGLRQKRSQKLTKVKSVRILDIRASITAIFRLKTSNGRAVNLHDVTFFVTGLAVRSYGRIRDFADPLASES